MLPPACRYEFWQDGRTRLRLLNLMREGEVCVCFLAATLETNDPKISRHLSYLKRASLVAGGRDGKWMHYRINEPNDPVASQLLQKTLEMIESEPEMQKDRKRLVSVCCPPTAPEQKEHTQREQRTPFARTRVPASWVPK